jgi:hypothetical protein
LVSIVFTTSLSKYMETCQKSTRTIKLSDHQTEGRSGGRLLLPLLFGLDKNREGAILQ